MLHLLTGLLPVWFLPCRFIQIIFSQNFTNSGLCWKAINHESKFDVTASITASPQEILRVKLECCIMYAYAWRFR